MRKERPGIPLGEVRAVAVPMTADMAPSSELLMYETEDGKARIECRFAEETPWMSQAQMADLFQTTPQNITLHLKALYEEGEINRAITSKDSLQVRTEGKRSVHRTVQYYNLDGVLAVGYRVRSLRGTEFLHYAYS